MFSKTEEYYHSFPTHHRGIIDDVFVDIDNIDTFVARVSLLSNTPNGLTDVEYTNEQLTLYPLTDSEGLKLANNFKGDALEFLVEIFLKQMGTDLRIGVTDYEVGDPADDYGVDGFGKGFDGQPACVQVKFRTNPTHMLTATGDHLTNFITRAICYEGVPHDTQDNLLIITTGEGTHHKTQQEFLSGSALVRTIGIEELRTFMGSKKHPNPMWWNFVREVVALAK